MYGITSSNGYQQLDKLHLITSLAIIYEEYCNLSGWNKIEH